MPGSGVREPVTSPTFVIARVHRDGRVPLVHVDAYRLGSVADVDDLDLDASTEDSVTVVEWGQGLVERLADEHLEVRLDRRDDDVRTAVLVPHGPAGRSGWRDAAGGDRAARRGGAARPGRRRPGRGRADVAGAALALPGRARVPARVGRSAPAQVVEDPASAAWVTGVVWDPERRLAVGRAGYHGPPDATGMVEVGYSIDPQYRRQGYARAALRALLARAAAEPGVRTFRATISPDNVASRDLVLAHGLVGRRGADGRRGRPRDRLRGARRSAGPATVGLGSSVVLVLALDTATPTLVAGLARWSRRAATEVLAERAVPSGTRHAELLTPAISGVARRRRG